MRLMVLERLVLLSILPKEGSFLTLKIVRELREALSFTEAEHQFLKFQQTDDQIRWDSEADQPVEIEMGTAAMGIIAAALKSLDEEKKLTEDHFELYEKFVEQ